MEGVACSWGDSLLAACRESLVCQGGTWQQGETWGSCPAESSITCPPQPPGSGSSCDGSGTGYGPCAWASGTQCACGCGSWGGACAEGVSKKWFCVPPPSGCPDAIPNAGEPCGTDGQVCKYGGCGAMATCSQGAWSWSYNPCPK